MATYEGQILENVSHYQKVKKLLEGRKDREAIEMIIHCNTTIAEYNQFEGEDWEEDSEEE